MPKLSIEATELVGTDVNFVSLVKRGANRIPFRIMKEENEAMLDLGKIGRQLFQKKEAAPALVGIILSKDADVEAITLALREAEIDLGTLTKTEDATSVSFAKADVASVREDEVSILKCSDDVSLVVTGLQKGFGSWNVDSSSFLDKVKASSFYSSVSNAAGVFSDCAYDALYDADSPAAASTLIGQMADDFKTYLTTLANGLPVQAFKADIALAKAGCAGGKGKKATTAEVEKAAKSKAKDPDADGDDDTSGAGDTDDDAGKKTKTTKAAAGQTGSGFGDVSTGSNTSTRADGDTSADPNKTNKDKSTKDLTSKLDAPVAGGPRSTGDGSSFAAPNGDSDRAGSAANEDIEADANTKGRKAQAGDAKGKVEDVHKAQGGKNTTGSGKTLPLDETGAGSVKLKNKQPEPTDKISSDDSNDVMAAIAALSKSIADQMAQVNTRVDEAMTAMKSDVDKVSAQVGSVAELARKTDEALNGTVLGDAGADRTGLRKSEGTGREPPLLDTAFMKRDAA